MATTVDELITKYTLDPSGYVTGGAVVTRTTKTISDDTDKAVVSMKSRFAELESGIRAGFNVLTAFGGAMVGIAAAYTAFGFASMQAAAQNEAMVKSLEAVVGSADKAQSVLKLLRDAAKAPGLGYSEAVQGFTGLTNSGLSGGLAYDVITQFANANARAGGGKDEFGRIMRAITQMSTKPFLQGDELLQLTEANLPAHKMVADKFGTSDTEELKRRGITSRMVIAGLVEELSHLERVGGGAKNAFDNAGDAFNYMQVKIGEGINRAVLPFANAMTEVIEVFSDAGVFGDLADTIMTMFNIPESVGDGPKNMMLDVLSLTVEVAASMRNFVENSRTIIGNFSELIRIMAGVLGSRIDPAVLLGPIGFGAGGGLSPADEAANFRRLAEQRLDAHARKGNGSDPFGVLDAIKGSMPGGIEKASTADRIAEYTRETAQNTRAMREAMRDAIIGGGFFGSKGVTHREAARFVNSVVDSRV